MSILEAVVLIWKKKKLFELLVIVEPSSGAASDGCVSDLDVVRSYKICQLLSLWGSTLPSCELIEDRDDWWSVLSCGQRSWGVFVLNLLGLLRSNLNLDFG